ncbi:hypothetical protein BYT27DRAFT_7197349 [Phlegmacium glaucopus]|nr:hypothetical protein BYT27DRAFT_7197349 [Phlegmacium glaucopus]
MAKISAVDDQAREEGQVPGSSIHESESQLDDDDNVSEDSFGSDFGDYATPDEEDLATSTDVDSDVEPDVEPDSPPPVYPDDEYPQTTFTNMDLKSPPPPVVLQYTPTTSTEPTLNANSSSPSSPSIRMCVVCKLAPAYSKSGVSYPTCGLTCASKMQNVPQATANRFLPEPQSPPQYTSIAPSSASQSEFSYSAKQGSVKGSRTHGSASQIKMCDVCHVRPRVQKAGKIYPTCGLTCAAILLDSPSSRGNAIPTLDPLLSSYQNLSLSDHSPSNSSYYSPQQPSRRYRHDSRGQHRSHGQARSHRGSTRTQIATNTGHHRPRKVHNPCVVCLRKPCRDAGYVTCGMKCAEKLCRRGSSNPRICDYCHRRPKVDGYNQCGKTCGENANRACLLCRCRPRFGRYHLCGRTCKKIASKWTPLILEAPPGHATYNEVEKRFKRAWNSGSGPCPPIKKIYKIIENKSFLVPYDRYKKTIGNEVFRYHGTKRGCNLGSQGNMRLCSSTACALCSILRTSFNVSLANPSGAFGPGVYTSSAANKAYSYANGGTGAIILTKVVLGTVYTVQGWNQVMSCPAGYNSVVFDRQNGALNETIVYTDDAIRPVFLIVFQ